MWEAEEEDSVQDNKGEGKGKRSMKSPSVLSTV